MADASTLTTLYTNGANVPLDVSFAYDDSNPEGRVVSESQADINASLIASSVSRTAKDPAVVYEEERRILSKMTLDEQAKYFTRRVFEESNLYTEELINRYTSAVTSNIVVPGTPEYEETASKVTSGFHTLYEQLYGTGAQIENGVAAAARVNGSGTFSELAWEQTTRNVLFMNAMEALGYNPKSVNPFKQDSLGAGLSSAVSWLREFIPGNQMVKIHRFDIGPMDAAKIHKMSPQQRIESLRRTLDQAIAKKATMLDLFDIVDAHDPGVSAVWPGLWYGLDAVDVFFAIPKVGSKAFRLANKARILRKYSSPANVAADVGAKDVAARLSAAVLTSKGSAAKDATRGLDAVTAGMNASPFPYVRLDPAVTDGAAHATLSYIEDHRKLQHYYITKAINKYSAETTGMLRPGEREVARANILSKLPTNAEVVESTPLGIGVKVTIPNPAKFATPEDLALAERRYNVYRDAYQSALDDLDRFYSEIGKFDPDPAYVANLEARKVKAKKEMDDAYKILTKGIEPDSVSTQFVFYNRDKHTGEIYGVMETNPLWESYISPSGYLRSVDDLLVPERTEMLAKQERLLVLFQKTVREMTYGLSKKEMKNVGALLSYGSDNRRIFSVQELTDVGVTVPGFGTIRLNRREAAAYYKARETMDAAWGMRSLMKYKELQFKGYSKQTVLDIVGSEGDVFSRKLFVKPYGYKTLADGTTQIAFPAADELIDATGRGYATVTSIKGTASDVLREKIQKGKAALVQFESPVRLGDKMYNYGVISVKRMKEITPDVLGYRNAYVPNMYKAPYAVRVKKAVTFDGRDTKEIYETVRFFGTKQEADAWKTAQNLLPETEQKGWEYVADADHAWRSADKNYARDVEDAVFTGLYEDYRGAKIPFGPEGKDTPTESAFVAMDRYLDNLAWTYPINDWKEGVLARYFNSVSNHIEPTESLDVIKFKPGVDKKTQSAVYALNNWVKDQLSIISENEMAFSRWMKAHGEAMETSWFWNKVKGTKLGEKVEESVRLKMLYGADNVEGYGLLRNLAFRAYLGFFNLSQLVVQASNAAVVFSLHPLNSGSVMRRLLALRTMAFANPATPGYEKAVRIAAKAALMKYDEFEPMIRAWHTSGWAYTTRSSADARTAMRMLSPGGTLNQTVRTIDHMMMWPFTEGELWSRMYGWLDAYTRLDKKARKAGKVVDWTRPDGLAEVIREAQRVAFNYTRANQAYWQKGVASIPTQFLQVPAKFYEELLMPLTNPFRKTKFKSQFTAMERLRMIAGQAVLFGAAGVPLGGYLKDSIAKMFTEEGEYGTLYPDVTDDQIVAISGGITDWVAQEILQIASDSDVAPALSQRVSLANGFNMLFSNFTRDYPSTMEALIGAFGGAAGGVLAQQIYPALDGIYRAHWTQYKAGTLSPEDAFDILMKLGTTVKTLDNIQTARLWAHYEKIASEKGTPIMDIDPEGEDRMTMYLKAAGIDTYDRYAALRMREWNKKYDPGKEISRTMKAAETLFKTYMTDGTYDTFDGRVRFWKELQFLGYSLASEEDREEFNKRWSEMLLDDSTLVGKEMQKYLSLRLEYEKEDLPAPPIDGAYLEQRGRGQE